MQVKIVFCLFALALLQDCSFLGFGPLERTPFAPVDTQQHMVVMLPGLGDDSEELQYFPDSQHDSGQQLIYPDSAWLAVDATIGYYRQGRILREFQQQVLTEYPNREMTLLGVSLGGFGSLILAAAEPDRYEELILIAPFLGSNKFLDRVREQGAVGLAGDSRKEIAYLRIWRHMIETKPSNQRITVLIGEDDRFAPAVRLLAEKAPHVEVLMGPGGHNWETWRQLWQDYLLWQCPRQP